ncbi:MAG: hypothetical protein JWP16_2054 [Alphaproteobacteria bacterium]|jgi:hypothetical protein|nr:hypothetical protein [Alphaproteobacteria bacterium]MDB5741014.1 hypothetical protein [Alphaproteobacteria bacterium]
MRLQLSPTNGWGWFNGAGEPMDVPPPFSVEVTVTQAGDPFTSVLGQVPPGTHPLAGKWLILTPRRTSFSLGFDGYCNLFGFDTRPHVPKINEALADKPSLTGSVQVDEMID